MRLGSCLYQNQVSVFIEVDHHYYLPGIIEPDAAHWKSMQALIEHPERDHLLKKFSNDSINDQCQVEASVIKRLAPIPRPNKNVICMGLNYLDHIAESANFAGRTTRTPKAPIVFTKSNACVIAHNEPIKADSDITEQLDWEVELAVVIGKTGKSIQADQVKAHIFGYTIINDISARDLQFAHKQFYIGKSIDGGCPMGPVIVTADAIADAQNLKLSCSVNGIEKQSSSTAHMIFSIEQIIMALSKTMTLEAGDVIATGTPDGVGFARTPPEFLVAGDVVACEIESIGTLTTPVI